MSSDHDRAESTVRVVAFIVAFLAVSIVLGMFASRASAIVSFYMTILSILMPIVLVIIFRRFWDRETIASLGLELKQGWVLYVATGQGLAAVLVTTIFAVEYFSGWLTVKTHFAAAGISGFLILTFLVVVVGAFGAAFAEELVFRGYLLQNIAKGWGTIAAVVATSLLFGFAHLFNPNFVWLVGLNLALAGLLLAYGYVITGSLWLPISFHLVWNVVEGYIFGLPVSGLSAGKISLLISEVNGPIWLTGGVFGPEGGLIATIAYLIGFLFLWALSSRLRSQSA